MYDLYCVGFGLLANLTHLASHIPATNARQTTVYVRSPYGHDLGKVLKRTVFTLHPSFNNHIRGPWSNWLACCVCPICVSIEATADWLAVTGWLRSLIAPAPFSLHKSIHAEVTEHPYEVTEKGWGEFEAIITLDFRVTVAHQFVPWGVMFDFVVGLTWKA